MDKNQSAVVSPYVRGGTPGALVAFIATEAILSIVSCAIIAIAAVATLASGYASAANIIGLLVSVPLAVYTTVLVFRAFLGLKALHRGDGNGARTVAGVCTARRILVWISFGGAILIELIAVMGSVGSNTGMALLAIMLTAGISLIVIIPVVLYYKSAEDLLGHISYEALSGRAARTGGFGRLSVLCIIFASLLAVFSLLIYRNIINISYEFRQYSSLIALYLFLSAARFLIINRCYIGFQRSHAPLRTDENASLAPAGYSDAPALCVLGSVAFGWFALELVNFLCSILFRSYGYPHATDIIRPLLFSAAYILLGLALVNRRSRTPLAIAGAGCFLLTQFIGLFTNGYFGNSDIHSVCSLAGVLFLIAFFVMFIIGIIIRAGGKTVPSAMRIIMIVFAALSTGADLISDIVYQFGSGYSSFILYSNLSTGLFLVALLALVRLLRVPLVPEDETVPEAEDTLCAPAEATEGGTGSAPDAE